jgi:phytanoyl-CoA hydroxylase
MNSILTRQDRKDLEEKGYMYLRGLLATDDVKALKEQVAKALESALEGEDLTRADGARADGRELKGTKKFRKLGRIDRMPEVWRRLVLHPTVQKLNRHFLGDNVCCRGVFVFTKPAKVGEPTPWHQDIGLWTQRPKTKTFIKNYEPTTNIWLALDPATKENGCLQVVPGSHKGKVIDHVNYDDAVHVELPRELTVNLEVEHVELAPGDALLWHSNIWHYSPQNMSEQNRWGMGMVCLDEENIRAIGLEDDSPLMIRDGRPQAKASASG